MGVEFIKGTILIEVHAITRQRLIQTGSTNYNTYDFEQGQNLYWCVMDRYVTTQELKDSTYTNIHQGEEGQTFVFDRSECSILHEQIPVMHTKSHTVHFPQLDHGKIWRWADYANSKYYAYLIPGAQGVTTITQKDGERAIGFTNQEEFLSLESTTAPGDDLWIKTKQDTFQPQVSYPSIRLAQPRISDETGEMKFNYYLRVTTHLDTRIHLYPDYNRNYGSSSWPEAAQMQQGRIAFQLPTLATVKGAPNLRYYCYGWNPTH